jgi:protein-S-isoprenylcysteine O-methyltransferase Ste14
MEYESKRHVTPKRKDAAKTIRFGLIVLGWAIALGLVPLAIGESGINKYVVAFAFVGGCLGLLCLLLGAIERLEQRVVPSVPPACDELSSSLSLRAEGSRVGERRGEGASEERMR